MENWKILLEGPAECLQWLEKLLPGAAWRVYSEGGFYYLDAPELSRFEDPAVAIVSADAVLRKAVAILRLYGNVPGAVRAAGATRTGGGVLSSLQADLYVLDSRQLVRVTQQCDGSTLGEALLSLAGTESAVGEVLTLIGLGDNPFWASLYVILELVTFSVGGEQEIAANGWLSKAAQTNLRRTAAFHRHRRGKFAPPPSPVSYAEAKRQVRELVRLWIENCLTNSQGQPGV